MPQNDRPQPPLTRANAPTAFALRNIADAKARGRLRAAATAEAVGKGELEWTDADGWRYQLESPPRVTIAAKDIERAAATVDLRVWDASDTLIFRDRIHAWDGFPVLVPDGTEHEEDDGRGAKIRVSNFRESPLEATRSDLAHTVRVVTKNGPWVKDKPGTVSTFYSATADGYLESRNTSSSYTNARAGTGGAIDVSTADTYSLSGQRRQSGGVTYNLWEAFFDWDVSAIGSDVVSASVISFYITAVGTDTTSFTSEIRGHDWGGSLTTADWIPGADLGAKPLYASLASGSTTTSAYNEFTNDGTTLVDATSGTVSVVVHSDKLRIGTAPASDGLDYINITPADASGTTQDPKLVVTHAAASVPFRRSLLGVGV